jgi:hypothetical protein
VEHRGEADLDAQPLGIGSNRQHCLRGSFEQEIVDDGLVLVGDGSDPRRHREHDVEVRDAQQFGLALLQPCARLRALALGTMPIAAANGRCPLAALWANPVMVSWRFRSTAI